MKVSLNYKNVLNFVSEEEIKNNEKTVLDAKNILLNKKGEGADFLGWIEYANNYDKEEYTKIKIAAEKIRKNSDVLIVIGIGGSYLGAKAIIESLQPYFRKDKDLEVIFVGNNLSSSYMAELLEYVRNKDFSINVISKSGTTTEPAIAFRLFRQLLIEKYGSNAHERIYATTDKEKGALRMLATNEGYETFVVPDDIGGRYSWFTAVGLLPVCASGINIDNLMKGASDAYYDCKNTKYLDNSSLLYASIRNLLYNKGKMVEVLVNYEPKLTFISEWWKQLYGESEGKDQKGIFPAAVDFSTDLHSMGQFIQDGSRIMFETVLNVEKATKELTIEEVEGNIDGLNFLAGKTVDFVNKQAFNGTLLAHCDGGVPNMILNIPELTPYYFGQLVYFFEKACAISGYLLGVNPFDQPGVEAYKKNMFALLGKPGFEDLKAELEARLK